MMLIISIFSNCIFSALSLVRLYVRLSHVDQSKTVERKIMQF